MTIFCTLLLYLSDEIFRTYFQQDGVTVVHINHTSMVILKDMFADTLGLQDLSQPEMY